VSLFVFSGGYNLLKSEYMEIKWSAVGKSYYIDLGYYFTKIGYYFTVKISDIMRSSRIRIDLICDNCKVPYNTSISDYSDNKSCKEYGFGAYFCRGCVQRSNTQEFANKVFKLVGEEYRVLGEYIKSNVKIEMFHEVCGKKWNTPPNAFLSGSRCYHCSNQSKKDINFITEEVFSLVGDEYTVFNLITKKNTLSKFEIKHNVCGFEYLVPWFEFKGGYRCPKCRESKGEKRIENYLMNSGNNFLQQYKFEDCRNKLSLPFDFAIFDENKKLICLVEYDGVQHYKPINFNGTSQEKADLGFSKTKENDNIKNLYCKRNEIPLLRIKYTDFDLIEPILEVFLFSIQVKTTQT